MLVLGGARRTARRPSARVRGAIASGAGLEKFREIIERQGGDPRVVDDYARLPAAPDRATSSRRATGSSPHIDAELVGRATVVLGAGRDRVEDRSIRRSG